MLQGAYKCHRASRHWHVLCRLRRANASLWQFALHNFRPRRARLKLTFLLIFQGLENLCPNRLLTDRSSYIGYLETQLERITDACLTVHALDGRVEELASGQRRVEEKVNFLSTSLCYLGSAKADRRFCA